MPIVKSVIINISYHKSNIKKIMKKYIYRFKNFKINFGVFKLSYQGNRSFFYSYHYRGFIKMGIIHIPSSIFSKMFMFLKGYMIRYFTILREKFSKLPKYYLRNTLNRILNFSKTRLIHTGLFIVIVFFGFLIFSYHNFIPADIENELKEIDGIGGFGDLNIDEKSQKEIENGRFAQLEEDEKKKDALLGITKSSSDKVLKKHKYKVQPGDTLSKISQKFNISVESIAGSTNIQTPDTIRVGQTLHIPSKEGFYYTIKKNDRLASIAQKYKISLEAIYKENQHIDLDLIKVEDEVFLLGAKPKNLIRGWLVPVFGRTVTSNYGWRRWPRRAFHKGIDLKAFYSSVRAAKRGRVTYAGWLGGYGKAIVISHSNGYKTLYAHLSRIYVKKNTNVPQGRVIGKTGNTGYSFGPHLHFEVSHNGRNINPRRFLKGLKMQSRRRH